MDDEPVRPPLPAWTAALAATAVAPGATVTPAMLARLADSTEDTAPALPLFGLATSSLPAIDVRFDGATAQGDRADLVLSELLAEGGMGRVFRAEQRSLAREVAVKTVRDPLDQAQMQALLWEGQIAGHLDHPGVTPVHLLGTSADGQTVLVMKRIVGVRWSDLIDGDDEVWRRFRGLPGHRLRAHVEILMEVARTVHFAHTRGILHLDIKPDNVMIGELGEVYVVDWGVATPIARARDRRGFVGTPLFAAPELVLGEPVGPHTDVFLLGATLHYALTRTPRHQGEGLLAVLDAAARCGPVAYAADLPRELGELANRATRRDPAERPRDALEFREALGVHLEHTTSLSLTRDGERLLVELEHETDPAKAQRLATEARFAFRGAVDRWAGNDDARRGLARCLELGVAREIDRENLPAARELAAELGSLPDAVAARLAALEALVLRRQRSEEALAKLEAEGDLAQGATERTKLLALLLAAAAAAFIAFTLLVSAELAMNEAVALSLPVGGVLVLAVLVHRFRRGLLANQVGRRLTATFFLLVGSLAIHRAGTVLWPLDVLAGEIRSELLLLSAIGATVALFVSRRLLLLASVPLVGAAIVSVWPPYADAVFNACGFLSLVAAIVFLVRSGRRREHRATADVVKGPHGAARQPPPDR